MTINVNCKLSSQFLLFRIHWYIYVCVEWKKLLRVMWEISVWIIELEVFIFYYIDTQNHKNMLNEKKGLQYRYINITFYCIIRITQQFAFCKNKKPKQILLYSRVFYSLVVYTVDHYFSTISKTRTDSWIFGVFWFGLFGNGFKKILEFCQN